ncbi:hypothetical protein NUM3379_25170 [Kineococcus sp. NUM-3379]
MGRVDELHAAPAALADRALRNAGDVDRDGHRGGPAAARGGRDDAEEDERTATTEEEERRDEDDEDDEDRSHGPVPPGGVMRSANQGAPRPVRLSSTS